MTTYVSKIQTQFNLANIKECLEDHNGKGRAILLDLIGTLAGIGLATKEISHNEWAITYITDIDTRYVKIDFEHDCITSLNIDNDTFLSQSTDVICSAENLYKLCIGLEYGYTKANSK